MFLCADDVICVIHVAVSLKVFSSQLKTSIFKQYLCIKQTLSLI